MCTVGEHDRAEIGRRLGRVNRFRESSTHQERESTGVIEMCMRQHDGVDLLDRTWKRSILRLGVTSRAAPANSISMWIPGQMSGGRRRPLEMLTESTRET